MVLSLSLRKYSRNISQNMAQNCSLIWPDSSLTRNRAGPKRKISPVSIAGSQSSREALNVEVTRYRVICLTQAPLDRSSFPSSEFWYYTWRSFSCLSKAGMRMFAIPVSSCASENVFSTVAVENTSTVHEAQAFPNLKFLFTFDCLSAPPPALLRNFSAVYCVALVISRFNILINQICLPGRSEIIADIFQ